MAKQTKKYMSVRAKLRESIRARLARQHDEWLGPEALYRLEYGVAKYALGLERRGMPTQQVREMTHAYHERMLELRRLEERIKLEYDSLGFAPYQWEEVQMLVRELYRWARKYDDWTLRRLWAYKATQAVWDGLAPRAVHRLLYRCWFLIKGSNALSDVRNLRQAMAACSPNPGGWHVSA